MNQNSHLDVFEKTCYRFNTIYFKKTLPVATVVLPEYYHHSKTKYQKHYFIYVCTGNSSRTFF